MDAPTDAVHVARTYAVETVAMVTEDNSPLVSSTGSSPPGTPSTPAAPPLLAQSPSQEDGREPSSFFNSWSRRKNRELQMCRLQQDNQALTEEVKAQKVGCDHVTPGPWSWLTLSISAGAGLDPPQSLGGVSAGETSL